MIKAVLFDLDGTLHDRESSLPRFITSQHDRLPALHPIPKHHYVSRFLELDAHGRRWKDAVYQTLVAEFAITGLNWRDLLKDYEAHFCRSCVPFPDLQLTLAALRSNGFELGLISNGFTTFQFSVIRALGIERFFSAILISEAEGIRKPDPGIFRRALERLHSLPGESVFVGDDPVSDIAGANDAGMKAVWLRNPVWPPPGTADAIINGLHELPDVIQRLQ